MAKILTHSCSLRFGDFWPKGDGLVSGMKGAMADVEQRQKYQAKPVQRWVAEHQSRRYLFHV